MCYFREQSSRGHNHYGVRERYSDYSINTSGSNSWSGQSGSGSNSWSGQSGSGSNSWSGQSRSEYNSWSYGW